MPNDVPLQEVIKLRSMGLTDALIVEELAKKGYSSTQVMVAFAQLGEGSEGGLGIKKNSVGNSENVQSFDNFPAPPLVQNQGGQGRFGGTSMVGGQDAMYLRFEEIAENIIDAKWDELISEVKKIVEWKQQVEERLQRAEGDLAHLKDDFKILHQGVLGKLDEYDGRMRDVGTDLKAVGKVFKEVVPQFVENVKELSAISKEMKGK